MRRRSGVSAEADRELFHNPRAAVRDVRRNDLETQVDAECLVEFGHEACGQLADVLADALDGNRSDLLGVGFGVMTQAGEVGRQQDLEWIDPLSA